MKQFIILGILISLAFPRRDCLKEAERDALGRSTRPEKDTFAISDSGYFYIHYDITGNNAPDLTDNNGNLIPDYVDEVGMIADSARHVLINIMDFSVPPFDEDSIYDIYIESYAAGVYGYNTKDNGNTSYLQIDNDYVGYDSKYDLTPIQIMQITVGHEYFHGIQWGYRQNTSGSKYLYEMTSMWFEDILIPDGNDYLDGWADALLNNPTADFDNTGGGYELALFGHYLSSFIDEDGQIDAKKSTIMLEIWKNFASNSTSPSALLTIQNILETKYKVSLTDAWVDFISRNLYNGIYEDMDNDFYYYIDQALIGPIQTNTSTLNDSISFELDLDNKSVAIRSYSMGDLNTIVEIEHAILEPLLITDYIGRIATLSQELDVNDMIWNRDTLSKELYPDDKIHFIYSTDQSSSTIIINAFAHTVPVQISGLVVSAAQDSLILSWNPSPGPGDSLYYIIYRDGDSIFQTIDTTYTDRGINDDVDYNYAISCYNDIGESQLSGIVFIQSWPSEDNVTQNQILSIYPNPIRKTHDARILYALNANYSPTNLELINVRGQIVKTVTLQSYQRGWHRESINNLLLPEAASGLYIIRLRPDNGRGLTQKITILP